MEDKIQSPSQAQGPQSAQGLSGPVRAEPGQSESHNTDEDPGSGLNTGSVTAAGDIQSRKTKSSSPLSHVVTEHGKESNQDLIMTGAGDACNHSNIPPPEYEDALQARSRVNGSREDDHSRGELIQDRHVICEASPAGLEAEMSDSNHGNPHGKHTRDSKTSQTGHSGDKSNSYVNMVNIKHSVEAEPDQTPCGDQTDSDGASVGGQPDIKSAAVEADPVMDRDETGHNSTVHVGSDDKHSSESSEQTNLSLTTESDLPLGIDSLTEVMISAILRGENAEDTKKSEKPPSDKEAHLTQTVSSDVKSCVSEKNEQNNSNSSEDVTVPIPRLHPSHVLNTSTGGLAGDSMLMSMLIKSSGERALPGDGQHQPSVSSSLKSASVSATSAQVSPCTLPLTSTLTTLAQQSPATNTTMLLDRLTKDNSTTKAACVASTASNSASRSLLSKACTKQAPSLPLLPVTGTKNGGDVLPESMPMIMEVYGGISDHSLVQLHSQGSVNIKGKRVDRNSEENVTASAVGVTESSVSQSQFSNQVTNPSTTGEDPVSKSKCPSIMLLGKSAKSPIVLDDYEVPVSIPTEVIVKKEKVDMGYNESFNTGRPGVVNMGAGTPTGGSLSDGPLIPLAIPLTTSSNHIRPVGAILEIQPSRSASSVHSARNHFHKTLQDLIRPQKHFRPRHVQPPTIQLMTTSQARLNQPSLLTTTVAPREKSSAGYIVNKNVAHSARSVLPGAPRNMAPAASRKVAQIRPPNLQAQSVLLPPVITQPPNRVQISVPMISVDQQGKKCQTNVTLTLAPIGQPVIVPSQGGPVNKAQTTSVNTVAGSIPLTLVNKPSSSTESKDNWASLLSGNKVIVKSTASSLLGSKSTDKNIKEQDVMAKLFEKVNDYDKMAKLFEKHKGKFDLVSLLHIPERPYDDLLLALDCIRTGYICRGCHSHFMLKSTLSDHQLRRTMCIRYECSDACRVLFYNPCQLYLHHRLHKPVATWRNNIDIKGLPEDIMEKSAQSYRDVKERLYKEAGRNLAPKAISAPTLAQNRGENNQTQQPGTGNGESEPAQNKSNEKAAPPTGDVGIVSNDEVLSPPLPQTESSVLKNKPAGKTPPEKPDQKSPIFKRGLKILGAPPQIVNTTVDDGRVLCVECGLLLQSRAALAAHMNCLRVTKDMLFCKICPVVLRSKCAQQAHSRIHKNLEPYVCPECGQVIHGPHKVFWKHLHVKCAHHIRQATFKCFKCSTQCSTKKQLSSHIKDKHTVSYYKCMKCPMAFGMEKSFLAHNNTSHNGEGNPRTILKCCICHSVYNTSDSVTKHIEQEHLEKSKGEHVAVTYRCNACSVNFDQRNVCISHMEKVHKFYFNHSEMCHICGIETKRGKVLFNHIRIKHTDIHKLDKQLTQKLRENGIIGLDDSGPNAKPTGSDETSGNHGNSNKQQTEVNAPTTTTEELSDKPNKPAQKLLFSLITEPSLTAKPGQAPSIKTENEDSKEFSCSRCQTEFLDAEAYQRHMAKHRFIERKRACGPSDDLVLKVKIPKVCKDTKTGPAKPKKFTRQVPGAPVPEPRLYCPECGLGLHFEEDLNKHLKEVHRAARQFPCHLCGKVYEEVTTLKKHVLKEHESWCKDKPYVCWICQQQDVRRGYPNRILLIKHLSTVHKIPRNMIDYSRFPDENQVKSEPIIKSEVEKSPSEAGSMDMAEEGSTAGSNSLGDAVDTVKSSHKRLKLDGESSFSCAKCSFIAEDREEFLKHIVKHLNQKVEDLNQCKECGLIFSVIPSLKKHLFVVHKIRNFTRYMEESGIDLVTQPQEEEITLPKRNANPPPSKIRRVNGMVMEGVGKGGEPAGSDEKRKKEGEDVHECTVCYKLYNTDVDLRTHMRTHGMAFIRSKRHDVSL